MTAMMCYLRVKLFIVAVLFSVDFSSAARTQTSPAGWQTLLRCGVVSGTCSSFKASLRKHTEAGLQLALKECQRQFDGQKWNCSTSSLKAILKTSEYAGKICQ